MTKKKLRRNGPDLRGAAPESQPFPSSCSIVRPVNANQGSLRNVQSLSGPDTQIITGAVSAMLPEALLAFAQRLLHAFTVGNVDVDAHQPHRLAFSILEHFPPAGEPMDAPIGPDDAPFFFYGRVGFEGLGPPSSDAVPVVRMD